MDKQTLDQVNEILDILSSTKENKTQIAKIRKLLDNNEDEKAIELLGKLTNTKHANEATEKKKNAAEKNAEEESKRRDAFQALLDDVESIYVGLLLHDPKLIAKYYILYDDCFFSDEDLYNIYRLVLFMEGHAYAPVQAKEGFPIARNSESMDPKINELKNDIDSTKYDMEEIYLNLIKLFEIRKSCLQIPITSIQDKFMDITNYKLYDKMTLEEVKSAINQITVTNRFKSAILNSHLTEFITKGDNNLTNGLALPFPILNSVFKGIRKGETMAFAMPSNAGKSRFTINVATITAIFHKKKILVISNEMSEEKMKLCFITTIINHPLIQQLHGHKLKKSEGEILEYKFRPDKDAPVEVDKDGFILRKEGETQDEFIERLEKYSSEYNEVIDITDWVNTQVDNAISFMNITDHTNDELRKVIMNYYYKEQVEYVFYDTLKTDVNNIGIPEEIKRTATILANLAQNFDLYIYATLQLQESQTPPLNVDVTELAVSRTVKEVLDTLTLAKQIHRDALDNYEYSLNEVDTVFYDLEKFEDPDVRYYAFVVDKNRAGAKPAVLFRLNLAYNRWEELGYLRLKQTSGNE